MAMDQSTAAAKKCSKCGEVKGLGEFGRNAASKDGKQSRCAACYRSYVEANRESIAEANKKYAREHADRVRASKEKWLQENREFALAQARARKKEAYRNNPEKYKELAKRAALENPEKYRQRHQRWRAANPDKVNTHVSRLTDAYVRDTLSNMGVPRQIATPELIALKREQLAIKRMARELKKAATQQDGATP